MQMVVERKNTHKLIAKEERRSQRVRHDCTQKRTRLIDRPIQTA